MCNRTLPASQFTAWALSDDGLRHQCRACCAVASRQKKYSLTRDEVLVILEVPVCQSCGSAFVGEADMHFDHCPHTGSWRGVLCRHCNTSAGAGCLHQIERLRNLVNYLERHHEQV